MNPVSISVKDYFHQSDFHLERIPCINTSSIYLEFFSLFQLPHQQGNVIAQEMSVDQMSIDKASYTKSR